MQLDDERGIVRAAAGTSISELLRTLIPRGWFVPVTPGTRHVTVGGALAADVHGKNHHRDGSFARHVDRFTLVTGAGEVRELAPADELFGATAGGMGLTGVIVDAHIRLIPVSSQWMHVETERFSSIEPLMERMDSTDAQHRYSVAWIDLTRSSRGRAVLQQGDHADREALPQKHRSRSTVAMRDGALLNAPPLPNLVGRATVRAFNELWFRKAPAHRRTSFESASTFFYPLDAVGNWNRLYGPKGFLQYQFVVPFGREDVLLDAASRLTRAPAPVSLAVLKRFGPGDCGPLAFPIAGWTLTADMPAGDPMLGAYLDALDDSVAAAGGRVYLAKDARMRGEALRAMYPRLEEWREVRAKADPQDLLRSDLSVRLGLTAD